MGSVGDCYDNALCESFFATLECELLDRFTCQTPLDARAAVFDFIEGWYNTQRRHSALGYESPLRFEQQRRDLTDRGATLEAAGPVDATSASTSPLGNVDPEASALSGGGGAFSTPPGAPGMLDSSEVQVLCPSLVETNG